MTAAQWIGLLMVAVPVVSALAYGFVKDAGATLFVLGVAACGLSLALCITVGIYLLTETPL